MLSPTYGYALPRKSVESYSEKRVKGRDFAKSSRLVQGLDALASAHTGYNAEVAYLMAVLSGWTYADEKAIAAKLRHYGLEGAHVRRVSVQNPALELAASAYLVQSASGSSAVLAFCGPDPAQLIAGEAPHQRLQRPFAGGLVHAGLYAALEALWDDVHEALEAAREGRELDPDPKRKQAKAPLQALYLSGHGSGGALALLAAARLFAEDYRDWSPEALLRGVYTFGDPMAGDEAFRAASAPFAGRVFRHVYGRDLVPHLPAKSELSYVHVGAERRADDLQRPWQQSDQSAGRVRMARAVGQLLSQALALGLPVGGWFPAGLTLHHHAPFRYIEVSRRALDAKYESVVAQRTRLPRAAAEAVDAATRRVEGAVKNVEGTVKRWLGTEPAVN